MPSPWVWLIHFLHPRAKLICVICTWLSRSQCSFAFGKCTKKRQPGQRKRTRHDRKMQSDRADEKKLFALLDRLTCPCRTPCSTNHGSSKSMIGFMIGIAISWLLRSCRLISHGGERCFGSVHWKVLVQVSWQQWITENIICILANTASTNSLSLNKNVQQSAGLLGRGFRKKVSTHFHHLCFATSSISSTPVRN